MSKSKKKKEEVVTAQGLFDIFGQNESLKKIMDLFNAVNVETVKTLFNISKIEIGIKDKEILIKLTTKDDLNE
jgi:hypothetical protein